MKLRIVILPFVIFGLFGYGVSVLDRATDHGKKNFDLGVAETLVKGDVAKFKPSAKFVYNQ